MKNTKERGKTNIAVNQGRGAKLETGIFNLVTKTNKYATARYKYFAPPGLGMGFIRR